MPILQESDKSAYFPGVQQSGASLVGLLAIAQALCESQYGAWRSLELQAHSVIVPVTGGECFVPLLPIATAPAPVVQVRESFLWQRMGKAWVVLESAEYELEVNTGKLLIYRDVSQVRVSYTAGFDFSSDAGEVQQIKGIAGAVVDYLARRTYGALDSYLSNPEGSTGTESWNAVRPDQYLSALLLPLKKYLPRL